MRASSILRKGSVISLADAFYLKEYKEEKYSVV